MNPGEFVDRFREERASAILRTNLPQAVEPSMDAAVEAGFRIVEITLTTPDAMEHIRRLAQQDSLIVGAGTVLTTEQAREAVGAGATFLVSPVVDAEVIATANELNVAMMPGAHTPTEMYHAYQLGAQLQKLFPAPGIGAKFVKATLGPLPMLNIVPTNGVHEHNVQSFLKAGAHAVGFTNCLFDANDIAAGKFHRIRERGEKLLQAVGSDGP